MAIELPFPSSKLAGHGNGFWFGNAKVVSAHRQWAWTAARAAKVRAPDHAGDIPIRIVFVPPNNRGDRTNYPNRMKAYIDGIADALGVNDRRFVPTYDFRPPQKPGWVTVLIGETA
jgi:crossover junction endodeoxyribonuclease RusA